MGCSSWSDDAYKDLKRVHSTKGADDIFTNTKTNTLAGDMNPKGITFRESRDSIQHPESIAIAIFLDETGSMGKIPEIIVREKLGNLMNTLISHGVKDAHVLFGGIGDQFSDKNYLQVGQFEAGTEELNKWLTSIVLERNGGGQNMESYLLAWLIAGRHSSIDCFEKRGKKGFLFTIGDEACHPKLDNKRSSYGVTVQEYMGYNEPVDLSAEQLLAEAQRTYNVFHIHCQEGSYRDDPKVIGYWRKLLGERLILLDDYNAICETIASTVAVMLGADLDNVVKSFDGSTALTVTNAIRNAVSVIPNAKEGVIKL